LRDQHAGPALVGPGRHQKKAGPIRNLRRFAGARKEEREHNAKSKTAAFKSTDLESPRA
jgi:hypothetical protein